MDGVVGERVWSSSNIDMVTRHQQTGPLQFSDSADIHQRHVIRKDQLTRTYWMSWNPEPQKETVKRTRKEP